MVQFNHSLLFRLASGFDAETNSSGSAIGHVKPKSLNLSKTSGYATFGRLLARLFDLARDGLGLSAPLTRFEIRLIKEGLGD